MPSTWVAAIKKLLFVIEILKSPQKFCAAKFQYLSVHKMVFPIVQKMVSKEKCSILCFRADRAMERGRTGVLWEYDKGDRYVIVFDVVPKKSCL